MGSQILELIRQGWASLTGGWLYDPHQTTFCNSVHLYIWLFLLCTPFATFLYFPTTYITWVFYCITIGITVSTLKIINLLLHRMYDEAQYKTDADLKRKSNRSLKENGLGDDDPGIELQEMRKIDKSPSDDAVPSMVQEQPERLSRSNSNLSMDIAGAHGTIDFKVDVHRKDSSESSDSIDVTGMKYAPKQIKQIAELMAKGNGNGETSSAIKRDDCEFTEYKPQLSRQSSCDSDNICKEEDAIESPKRNEAKSSSAAGLERHDSSESAHQSYAELAQSELLVYKCPFKRKTKKLKKKMTPMRKDSNSAVSEMQLADFNKTVNNEDSSYMFTRKFDKAGKMFNRTQSVALGSCVEQPSTSSLSHTNSADVMGGGDCENKLQRTVNLNKTHNIIFVAKDQSLVESRDKPSNSIILSSCDEIIPLNSEGPEATDDIFYNVSDSDIDDGTAVGLNQTSRNSESSDDQSNDSESENNGSRSPLIENEERPATPFVMLKGSKNGNSDIKDKCEQQTSKESKLTMSPQTEHSSSRCSEPSSKNSHDSNRTNEESGVISSDCEQISASSKDMLIKKSIGNDDSLQSIQRPGTPLPNKKDATSLGAIPKVPKKKSRNRDSKNSVDRDSKRTPCAFCDFSKFDSPTSSSNSSNVFSTECCNLVKKENISHTNESEELVERHHYCEDRQLDQGRGSVPSFSGLLALAIIPARRLSVDSDYDSDMKMPLRVVMNPTFGNGLQQSGSVGGSRHDTMLTSMSRRPIDLRTSSASSHLHNRMRFRQIVNMSNSTDFDNGISKLKVFHLGSSHDDTSNNSAGTTSGRGSIATMINLTRTGMDTTLPSSFRDPIIEMVYGRDGPRTLNRSESYRRNSDGYTAQPKKPERIYTLPFYFLGRRELKLSMDRLQLLAIFDRDLNCWHVIFAIFLSILVAIFGSHVLQLNIYKDLCAFIFCFVMAGSQYSLLKSVQPDASSPVHGFNKTVAYSRPIYFCICSGLLIFIHHLMQGSPPDTYKIFNIILTKMGVLGVLHEILFVFLLVMPILFSLGLFPQINTFVMYLLEQFDIHVFGGNAVCSLGAAIINTIRSIIGCLILYGPAVGGLMELKGSQHPLFSMFCSLLIPITYHLSRCASDFSCMWNLIKSTFVMQITDDEDIQDNDLGESGRSQSPRHSNESKDILSESNRNSVSSDKGEISECIENIDLEDPLPKKLQTTVNLRLKNDLLLCTTLGIFVFALHASTVFTVLQPDINYVLYSFALIIGVILHYIIPQLRKETPWLCISSPVLRLREYGEFEASDASKVTWFEKMSIYVGFFERNIIYPLIFLSAVTADSKFIIDKFGIYMGTAILVVCALKGIRSCYSDQSNQYLILLFTLLLFRFDFSLASESFLIDYFIVSIVYKKICELLLKLQFIVTYIAPWQITWGSAFHAFAQPFSVPHSAMLFLQTIISSVLSTPLNPFLGSAIFLSSYVRPIKFWERDYNTKRIDHSNTRLSSQLERDLGADDNNLNSIFYEHLTRSLQHSLCGDLLLGRWGNVNQGDCFVLASDYLNCLVHIIELGNGLCTFQMRGLEFRGTYCQQREVEAISEEIEDNEGCCCCSPGNIPHLLSVNAMFSLRWLAWQVVQARYVLEGYSISDNAATSTLQSYEYRKVLITFYVKSVIYYTIRSPKLHDWLNNNAILEALQPTLERRYVDLDPIFNHNLDEDYDHRLSGITRNSFCSVYMDWIKYCWDKRKKLMENNKNKKKADANTANGEINTTDDVAQQAPEDSNTITRDSHLISLLLSLGLLARRALATASRQNSMAGVEFLLYGLHSLFKGDYRITCARDEWVFADMELLHSVIAPSVKMALKLHQDHFVSPDDYYDPVCLYEAIRSHTQQIVISHEADPLWRSAILRGFSKLLALRHVVEDGSDEYRFIQLSKRYLTFRVIKLNRECVRGLWAGQQQELIYFRNRNPERGSIQNAKQALRNIINSSCDQPIGYPIYVSPLITSYAETNQQLYKIIGGSITVESLQQMFYNCWNRIRQRCREGCSSGSTSAEPDETVQVQVMANSGQMTNEIFYRNIQQQTVKIIDPSLIYENLNTVTWPNEFIRSIGTRQGSEILTPWTPEMGYVGHVVHCWHPYHSHAEFRSNCSHTIVLVKLGDKYVPVSEEGVRLYSEFSVCETRSRQTTALKNTSNEALGKNKTDEQPGSDERKKLNQLGQTSESGQSSGSAGACSPRDDDVIEEANIYEMEELSKQSEDSDSDSSSDVQLREIPLTEIVIDRSKSKSKENISIDDKNLDENV